MSWHDVAEIAADAATLDELQVYEHGWQSWSPAGLYPATATSPRPRRDRWQTMAFRPERPAPGVGFQGEGLLGVSRPDGSATVWAAPRPTETIPSIRAHGVDGRLLVAADGEVERLDGSNGLAAVLEAWADRHAVTGLRTLGSGWCSWYCHWGKVTAGDIERAVEAVDRLALPIDVIQIDDGWQAEIGDWLAWSSRFGSLPDSVHRITDAGRHAGIWIAPFMVGAHSPLAVERPDLLVGDAIAADEHWGQRIGVLDVTHPEGADLLHGVFTSLRAHGITYFKCDFLYAGAMAGRRHGDADPVAAYRYGMQVIRDAVGTDAVVLGCGAPLLASIGLVDAMRVSPDVDPRYEPSLGDISQPGMRSARNAEQARRFLHGRWWLNDPDCLLVRPDVDRRDEWTGHVGDSGGLVISSDDLDRLDPHGLDLLRTALRPSAPRPVPWRPTPPEGAW